MHEHRRLGVPVRLAAHIDTGHRQVDLATALGEPDQPSQDRRDPVHVLGAAVHGDERPGGDREPLDRHAHPRCEVERGEDPSALRLGEVAQPASGVAEDRDPRHPLRHLPGAVAQDADDDVGDIEARFAVDRLEDTVGSEVVLHERARREVRGAALLRSHHPHDLVRVWHTEALRHQHLLPVRRQGPHRIVAGLPLAHRDPAPADALHVQDGLVERTVLPRQPDPQEHLLEVRTFGQRRERGGHLRPGPARRVPWRSHVEHDAVRLGASVRRVADQGRAHGSQRLQPHPAQPRVGDLAAGVVDVGIVAPLVTVILNWTDAVRFPTSKTFTQ